MSNASIPQTGQQRERRERNEEKKKEETTPRGPLQTAHGVTTIDENVVAKIAGMAAREVPGVYDMGNAVRRAFSAVTDRIPNAQTNVAGGISVRRNIIEQIEGTTGLEVVEVNINVTDVHLPDEDSDSSSSAVDLT